MGNSSRNCLLNCMSAEQERAYYESVLQRVYCNPKHYLENLEQMWVFRVSFLDYHDKRRFKVKKRSIVSKTTLNLLGL